MVSPHRQYMIYVPRHAMTREPGRSAWWSVVVGPLFAALVISGAMVLAAVAS